MPWGWECRSRLVKQIPLKPTERRGNPGGKMPGPNHYELPQIFCGNGFSTIKRAPAYTFGHLTKASFQKPNTTPYARQFNVRGIGRKGPFALKNGVLTPHIEPMCDKTKKPGPAAYAPRLVVQYKRPPAYSVRPVAKPPYQPWDQWTPPPNMYCPPILHRKPPAFTLGYMPRDLKPQDFPGPGEHEPKFNYVKKNKPSYSFGPPFRRIKPPKSPAPNAYCEKKYLIAKPTVPASSFGIRHTPYLGVRDTYTKSSKLDLVATD